MADYIDVMNKLDYLDDTKLQIKDAIIQKGQQIEDEASFRDYVVKILNIDAGKVKLYNNETEMYNDKNANVGDIALIYNTEFIDLLYGKSFGSVAIYKNLTLGRSVLNNYYSFSAYSSGNDSMYANVSGTDGETVAHMNIELHNNNQYMSLTYKSVDEEQKEFTFESGYIDYYSGSTQELIFNTDYIIFDFNNSITWRGGNSVTFNRVFKVKNIYFGGLFEYKLNQRQEMSAYIGINPHIDMETDRGIMEFTDAVDLSSVYTSVYEFINDTVYGVCTVNSMGGNASNKTLLDFSIYNERYSVIKYENKLYVYARVFSSREDYNDWLLNNPTYTKYNFDLDNYVYNEEIITPTLLEVLVNQDTYYVAILEEIPENIKLTCLIIDETQASPRYLNIIDVDATSSISSYSMEIPYVYKDKYMPAKTQLTVTDGSYLITGKTAYGKDGIYTGDGTYLKHTTTREFRDFFMPNMPDTYDSLGDYGIIQSGYTVPYYTFVNRKKLSCTDVGQFPVADSVITKLETLTQGTYTSELYNTVYAATYHRTFYCEDDDKLYFGYFGYNMSDKQSSSSSGGTIHEEFNQIYGILICLNDMTIYKTCNYTTTWRPFDGWGNAHEDPNANICFLNYDFINDEFVLLVDTGNWGWSGDNPPYLAMMRINGTTGVAVTNRWQVGRNGAPNTYVQISDVRYDITTKNLILPLKSFNEGGSGSMTHKILKMTLAGSKSDFAYHSGYEIDGYAYLGGEESFYTLEPIYYYYYTDGNGTTHYILKRIDDNRQVEIPQPYNIYSHNMRYIYDGGFYFFTSTRQESGKYPVYRVDLSTMTYEKVGEIPSYNSASFILYNKIPHIIYNNYIHSIDDIEIPKYLYYNSNKMYNDVRIDGVEVEDGNIQGMYPKVSLSSSGLSYYKTRQVLYHYHNPTSFRDITDDVCFVWPTVGNGTYGKQYMYYSLLIGMGVANTLTQEEFDQTQALVNSMLGGTQVPSPEIEYINECNDLANDINGE